MTNRDKILEFFRDENSNWKQKAQEGIEKNRKGNAHITFIDKNGQPVKNITVKAVQKTHEFKFGVNMFMIDGIESEEKTEKYKKYMGDTFNMATLPFYWDGLEPIKGKPRYDKNSPFFYRRPPIDLCLEFCREYGLEPREHAIGYDRFFPEWLYNSTVEEAKAELDAHYKELAERYADRINTIEVTNEMEWNDGRTAFYNEPDFIEWCFKTARKYFKENQLVINEHSWLAWVDRCRATDKYYSYIEANMLKGAPIDAIGMQYHMFNKIEKEYEATRPFYNPENLYRHMDLYAGLGKPLQVTEVTIPAYSNSEYDEAIQAEIVEDLYTIWFSHPAMEQIIYWNFADGYAHVWTSDLEAIHRAQGDMTMGENVYYGGLLRFDMTPKPAYHKLHNLIKNVWHTEADGAADNGIFDFRGFFGDYELEIVKDGKTYRKKIKLYSKAENCFNIEI